MIRIAIISLVALFACAVVVLLAGYRAIQHKPDFYVKALKQEPARQAEAGDRLEKQVLDLRNEVRRDGHWEAVFTDEQINGWLAVDLPEKFPNTLPTGVSDPRIDIDPEQVQLACRYDSSKISAVISLAVDVHLTDEPNVLALRIRRARAGALPIPLNRWLDQATTKAHNAGIQVRWEQRDGDPVALVTIPTDHEEYDERLLRLETIELRDGELYLAGRTERVDDDSPRLSALRSALD